MLSTLLLPPTELRPHIPPGLWMTDGSLPHSLSLIPLFLLGTFASSNASSSLINTSASALRGVFQLNSSVCVPRQWQLVLKVVAPGWQR